MQRVLGSTARVGRLFKSKRRPDKFHPVRSQDAHIPLQFRLLCDFGKVRRHQSDRLEPDKHPALSVSDIGPDVRYPAWRKQRIAWH